MYQMPVPGEITHFRAILAPDCAAPRTGVLRAEQAPEALVLQQLAPLRGQLSAVLEREDRMSALQLVYHALVPVAESLAAWRGDLLRSGQVRVHALMVELDAVPLESCADGTVVEPGTALNVMYCNWALDAQTAYGWAEQLTEEWRACWPGAWFAFSTLGSQGHSTDTGAGS